MTFHKSQGITAKEGCVVSFDGARGTQTVSKLGLAFVAWMRATLWQKMAFYKLPPLEDIIAARLTREFGKAPFVSDASKYGASIVASCEIILTCLRQEEFCVDVPAARTYPLFE